MTTSPDMMRERLVSDILDLEAQVAKLECREALLGEALMSAVELLRGDLSEAAVDRYEKALMALADNGWKWLPVDGGEEGMTPSDALAYAERMCPRYEGPFEWTKHIARVDCMEPAVRSVGYEPCRSCLGHGGRDWLTLEGTCADCDGDGVVPLGFYGDEA